MNIFQPVRTALALGSMLLLAACTGMRATSDSYPGADFSHYRSFAWIASDPVIRPAGTEPIVSSLTERRIREAIEEALRDKGYVAADSAQQADFVLAFIVGARDRVEAQSYPLEYRGPWLWRAYGEATGLRVYREGSLTIEIFDRATRQPVWRGSTSKEVTDADAANPAPLIRPAVDAILARFPSR